MKTEELIALLEQPTAELIERYQSEYRESAFGVEDKMQELIVGKVHDKSKYETILLTTIIINELYSTSIRRIDIMAKHIFQHTDEIHSLIANGDAKAINAIAVGHGLTARDTGKEFNFYSFASKYCNYLNPDKFPIYDSYVEAMLFSYNKKYDFADFTKADLKDYETFRNVVLKFRKHFGLEQFSLREIDKFLWLYGTRLVREKQG